MTPDPSTGSPGPDRSHWAPWLLAIPAMVYGAWLSWRQAFLCDDAFISFRYARNLLEGHGLVFNRGEWVEGYTNFAWVLEIAALWLVGIEPPTASLLLSGLATVATVATVAAWARQSTLPHRHWVVAATVVLLCTERSFAVWATGGLATRQFTWLVLAGLAALAQPGARAAGLGSAAMALAALTRPEAFLWAGVSLTAATFDRLRDRTLTPRMLALLALPFGVPVGAHLLWRRWAYGMWVPNTYIAKHVAPWIDMGQQYFFAVTVESGLWLLVPLACWGFAVRARRSGRVAELAGLVCVGLHAVFVLRVGGDHFEWRPLDPWWPILCLGAADGLFDLARRAAPRRTLWVALPALAIVLLYARVLEVAHDRLVFAAWDAGERPPLHVPLDATTAPLGARLPILSSLLGPYDRQLLDAIEHGNAIRQHRHKSFAEDQLQLYGPYLAARETLDLPPDLVAARGSVGIMPYHLPDLEVIDVLGLTDATVARNPVKRKRRHMAHDRRPPKGYLVERGVNVRIGPVAHGLREPLATHDCALQIGQQTWMSLQPHDVPWTLLAFEGRDIACHREDPAVVENNLLWIDGRRWTGVQLIGGFERSIEWTGEGRVRRRKTVPPQGEVTGWVGGWFLDTFHPTQHDGATAHLRSEPFEIPEDGLLSLRVGGGRSEEVGVTLWVDGSEVKRWHGHDSEKLRYRWLSLEPWAGSTAHVELVDASTENWGHVLLDHVVLYTPASELPPAP